MELLASLRKWLSNIIAQYKAKKKREEMYARLDRNGAGKFNQKDYIRSLNKTVKAEKAKIRDKQEDSRK